MKLSKYYPSAVRALFALCIIATTVQCSKDDHDHPEEIHEEEVINRVTLNITDASNSTNTITWNEGDTVPTISLSANATYQVSIHFYNASDPNDVEDITEEVIEEADEHHVFFGIADAALSIASASNDTQDGAGNPVNLKTVWTTTTAGSGTVRAYLIHEPTTKTASTRSGFGGETDVEVDFPVTIQ